MDSWASIAAVFVLAGLVKGITGLGLPPIALGLLTTTLGLHSAVAMVLLPALVSNLIQASIGGRLVAIIRRIWHFLIASMLTVGIGSFGLRHLDSGLLSLLLGCMMMLYASANLLGVVFTISASRERSAGLLFGTASGLVTGLTGSSAVPGPFYLHALGFERDEFVQALGIVFTLSTLGLAVALVGQGVFTLDLSLASGLAVIPAMLGMKVGHALRRHFSVEAFKYLFLTMVFVIGLTLVVEQIAMCSGIVNLAT
ncbi:sulfite exporter TauE/SafE family protein [Marinobacter shengliensis]